MFEKLITQILATSGWEWIAVIMAVFYILLAIKESVWCWPAAFFSTAIYMVLFFDASLYMESLLNVYYLAMAVFGWHQWYFKKQGEEVKPIICWPLKTHIIGISLAMLGVVISAYLLEQYTDQSMAYVDAFTTWFAVFATYMLTQKVLENWFYWVIIDAVSVYLYFEKGFLVTAILFIGYTIMAIVGWLKWKQHFEQQ